MPEHVSYCSACDRPVPVSVRAEADRAPDDPPQLVCLDYGTRCSGVFCPMVLWPPDEEDVESATLVNLASARRPSLPRAS